MLDILAGNLERCNTLILVRFNRSNYLQNFVIKFYDTFHSWSWMPKIKKTLQINFIINKMNVNYKTLAYRWRHLSWWRQWCHYLSVWSKCDMWFKITKSNSCMPLNRGGVINSNACLNGQLHRHILTKNNMVDLKVDGKGRKVAIVVVKCRLVPDIKSKDSLPQWTQSTHCELVYSFKRSYIIPWAFYYSIIHTTSRCFLRKKEGSNPIEKLNNCICVYDK